MIIKGALVNTEDGKEVYMGVQELMVALLAQGIIIKDIEYGTLPQYEMHQDMVRQIVNVCMTECAKQLHYAYKILDFKEALTAVVVSGEQEFKIIFKPIQPK